MFSRGRKHVDTAGSAHARPRDAIRARIRFMAVVFLAAFVAVVGRLVMFGLAPASDPAAHAGGASTVVSRPDIVDRNGEILATDIKMASLYAEPRHILDPRRTPAWVELPAVPPAHAEPARAGEGPAAG